MIVGVMSSTTHEFNFYGSTGENGGKVELKAWGDARYSKELI
jgi:hypothetical protein